MRIVGTIVSQEGKIAQAMIQRSSACGHDCETCGACAGKEHIIYVDNAIGVPIGRRVVIEVSDRIPLFEAFCVYILPIILCGGFYLLVSKWWSVIPAVTIWGVLLYYMNRKKGKIVLDGTVVKEDK